MQKALNIDGVEQIGLQSVVLRLTMKEEQDIYGNDEFEDDEKENNFNYFLIFDNYRSAFIWNRGLRTILHMITIKQPITTIAFCCSSVDRINNDEMHQKMKIGGGESEKWMHHIITKLPDVQKHIYRANRFAEASCILVCF